MIWEQEIYEELKYKAPLDGFHTFEGEYNMVGLSFAEAEEAAQFYQAVQYGHHMVQQRTQRLQRRMEVQFFRPYLSISCNCMSKNPLL